MSDTKLKTTTTPLPENKLLRIVRLLMRIILGAVLITSGAMKLGAPKEEFSQIIEAYALVPPSTALTLATFLPWIELLIGYSLLFGGYFLRLAAAASGILFVIFDLALFSLKIRGIALPSCGCFGGSFHPKPALMMGVDLVLFGMSILILKSPKRFALDLWAETRRGEKPHGK